MFAAPRIKSCRRKGLYSGCDEAVRVDVGSLGGTDKPNAPREVSRERNARVEG
jgi:hypothetical protein